LADEVIGKGVNDLQNGADEQSGLMQATHVYKL